MIQKLKLDDYFDQFENRRTNFILVIMCLPKTYMTLLIHHLPSSLQPRDLVAVHACSALEASGAAPPGRPIAAGDGDRRGNRSGHGRQPAGQREGHCSLKRAAGKRP